MESNEDKFIDQLKEEIAHRVFDYETDLEIRIMEFKMKQNFLNKTNNIISNTNSSFTYIRVTSSC